MYVSMVMIDEQYCIVLTSYLCLMVFTYDSIFVLLFLFMRFSWQTSMQCSE